jgi:hypothetical protein
MSKTDLKSARLDTFKFIHKEQISESLLGSDKIFSDKGVVNRL